MTLRRLKRAVMDKEWVLDSQSAIIVAATEFQARRLTTAATAARLYLEGSETPDLARVWNVTIERAAQIVRLGVKYLQQAGELRPAAAPTRPRPSPSKSGRGRG